MSSQHAASDATATVPSGPPADALLESGIPDGTVGRYEVGDLLGKGGMGAVYRAWDPQLQRDVAIKALRISGSESAGANAEARLVREARALAQLNHPNVVPVFHVESRGRRVYIAMELVEGKNLREWFRTQPGWREVLDVFLAAGQALAAAHDAGIVHRDFKPANVMLGDDGRVRVMDFGLAREIEGRSVGVSSSSGGISSDESVSEELTDGELLLGTPAYMAPEQHEGESAGPAADQYAFCVSLWIGLYGERPFEGRRLLRRKREGPPPRPRGPVPSRVHDALARGLAADPDERWPSMQSLLDALSRRSSQRWPYGVGGALAVAVAGGAYASATSDAEPDPWCLQQSELSWTTPRRSAAQERLRSSTSTFAESTTARTLERLDRHAEAWTTARGEACAVGSNVPLRRRCLESSRAEFDQLVRALDDAEEASLTAIVRAINVLPAPQRCGDEASLARRYHGSTADTAAQLEASSSVSRARTLNTVGRYESALNQALEAKTAAANARDPQLVAEASVVQGHALEKLGRLEEARSAYEGAWAAAVESGNDLWAATAATELAFVVGLRLADLEGGREWARRASARTERLGERGALFGKLQAIEGMLANASGDLERGVEHQRLAVQTYQRLYGDRHADTAGTRLNLAIALAKTGDLEAAGTEIRPAVEALEVVLGPEHPRTLNALNTMAGIAEMQGDLDRALSVHEQVLEVRKTTLGPQHIEVAVSLNNLANVHRRQGRFERAEETYRQAIEIRQAKLGDDHPLTGRSLANLGSMLVQTGKAEEGEVLVARALVVFEKAEGELSINTAETLGFLGEAYQKRGELGLAQKTLRRALAIYDDLGRPPSDLRRTQASDRLAAVEAEMD